MKLEKMIKITNGYPFESKSFISTSKGIPVIKIKELKKNNISLSKDTCYVNYNQSLSNFMLSNGDILIALTGNPPSKGGINAMVGRCSKYNLQTNAYLNQRVCKVESISPLLDNRYLFYFLSLDKTIMDLASRCSGSANQANISSNDIKDLEINLIEICNQRHIVDTTSSLFLKSL